jgi:hypothetical protein
MFVLFVWLLTIIKHLLNIIYYYTTIIKQYIYLYVVVQTNFNNMYRTTCTT